jgi:hypothetical protein
MRIVDLRSDTLTKPTAAMRSAMAAADCATWRNSPRSWTLARNRSTWCCSTERAPLEPLVGGHVLSMATPRLEGTVWRQLRESFRLGLVVAGSLAFAPACREATVRLGISKLVWIDRDGGIVRANGERVSFVHLDELREILAAGAPRNERRAALLREVEAMLVAGVPA